MARHQNDIMLAGPVSRVGVRMFANGGFLEANIAAMKVKFNLKLDQKSENLKAAAEQARSAVLTSGYFACQQDKKDSQKWWYNIGGRNNGVVFLDYEVPILNRAQVVGTVKAATGQWMMIGSRYMIPKQEGNPEWKDRLIWVRCSQPVESYIGQEVLVVGSARPKVEAEWRLHLVAEGVWVV